MNVYRWYSFTCNELFAYDRRHHTSPFVIVTMVKLSENLEALRGMEGYLKWLMHIFELMCRQLFVLDKTRDIVFRVSLLFICLNDTFPNEWIGRLGSIEWRTRWPFKPLRYFFWGIVKGMSTDITLWSTSRAKFELRWCLPRRFTTSII